MILSQKLLCKEKLKRLRVLLLKKKKKRRQNVFKLNTIMNSLGSVKDVDALVS